MTTHAPYSAFYPELLDPEWLERTLVRDEALLAHLTTALTDTATHGGARFDLVIGKRGAGKSHFISVLMERIANTLPNDGLAISVQAKEQITSYTTFLATILGSMPEEEEGEVPPGRQLANLQRLSPELHEERALAMIKHNLRDRAFLLLVDNLDRVMDAIGTDGQRRLRAMLQQEGNWSVLGTATTEASAFKEPKAPFFKAFTFHSLPDLSPSQFAELLTRLSETQSLSNPTEVDAIARVAVAALGHTPRAAIMLHPRLQREGKLREVLLQSLSQVALDLAPVYDALAQTYSPTQRAIVDVLGQNTEPVTVTEIAGKLFATHQTISGQLARLRAAGVVRSERVGRASYYDLREPMHRFALLVRQRPDAVARFVERGLLAGTARDEPASYRGWNQTTKESASSRVG